MDVLGADLRVDDSTSADVLTVRDDGERVAYATYDGVRWTVVNSDALGREQEIWTNLTPGPRDARVRTVGFLPGDEVVAAQTDPRRHRVRDDRHPRLRHRDGLTGLLLIAHPGNGLVAGQTEFTGDGSCSAVSDPRSGSTGMLWETCEHQLGAFSPNGSLLVGVTPYFDGLTSRPCPSSTPLPVSPSWTSRSRAPAPGPSGSRPRSSGGPPHPARVDRRRRPAPRRTTRARRQRRAGRRRGGRPASRVRSRSSSPPPSDPPG